MEGRARPRPWRPAPAAESLGKGSPARDKRPGNTTSDRREGGKRGERGGGGQGEGEEEEEEGEREEEIEMTMTTDMKLIETE